MKTTRMFLTMCVVMVAGCFPMEDLPLPPDAEPPTEEVDATPPVEPDATVPVVPDANTPDATVPEVDATPTEPDAGTPECDAAVPLPPDAAPVPPPDATPVTPDATPPCGCVSDADCDDGFAWTSDVCSAGTCSSIPTTCGGMRVKPSATAVKCEFWDGFGLPSGSSLGGGPIFITELTDSADGPGWKLSPATACSVKCYDAAWALVLLDIKFEWNGTTFASAMLTGLTKGTWDGLNVESP